MLGVTHLTSGSQVVPPLSVSTCVCLKDPIVDWNSDTCADRTLRKWRPSNSSTHGQRDSLHWDVLTPLPHELCPPPPRGSFVKRRHSFNKANKQEAWEKIMQPFLFKLNRRSSLLLSPRQIISIFFIFSDHTHSFVNIIGGEKTATTVAAGQSPITLSALRALKVVYLIQAKTQRHSSGEWTADFELWCSEKWKNEPNVKQRRVHRGLKGQIFAQTK